MVFLLKLTKEMNRMQQAAERYANPAQPTKDIELASMHVSGDRYTWAGEEIA